jgi:hypothetical protein
MIVIYCELKFDAQETLDSTANCDYHKFWVYMSTIVIEGTQEELILAIINRWHLVEKNILDWWPFGGSFTLTKDEVAKLVARYPDITFKWDSAHPDKEDKDAKIYLPSHYDVEEFKEYLFSLFDVKERIIEALKTELWEELFEELIDGFLPPLWWVDPNDLMSLIEIIPSEHFDYRKEGGKDGTSKHKYWRHTKVVIPRKFLDLIKQSQVVAVITEEDYKREHYKGYPFTPVMLRVLERKFWKK